MMVISLTKSAITRQERLRGPGLDEDKHGGDESELGKMKLYSYQCSMKEMFFFNFEIRLSICSCRVRAISGKTVCLYTLPCQLEQRSRCLLFSPYFSP